MRRGHPNHVRKAKHRNPVDIGLMGGAQLRLGGKFHGPVVRDRQQRADVLMDQCVARSP